MSHLLIVVVCCVYLFVNKSISIIIYYTRIFEKVGIFDSTDERHERFHEYKYIYTSRRRRLVSALSFS